MTPKQLETLARKYRLRAGELHYDLGRLEPGRVRDLVKEAHDNLCRAFMALEDAR